MTSSLVRERTVSNQRTLLLREQGVAGSNPVIPTSIYKERPSRGRSFRLGSGPIPVQMAFLSDNLSIQKWSVGVFRGGVSSPGQVRCGGSSRWARGLT